VAVVLFLRRSGADPAPVAAAPSPPPAAPAAPAPVAPAPVAPARVLPAPSPNGEVHLNRAGVQELMTLPGVGRQAAQRIVAHREANGPFSSLDDLAQVEGFHAERIRRIGDRVAL
jgi:competence protein ComEA